MIIFLRLKLNLFSEANLENHGIILIWIPQKWKLPNIDISLKGVSFWLKGWNII